jgi:hypothetical protein
MLAGTAFAERLPVKIRADDLRYNDETNLIKASGNVRVIYEDIEVLSNWLELNTKTNFVTASGMISVSQNGAISTGRSLFLNLKDKNLKLSNLSIEFFTPQVIGEVYLDAEEMHSSGNMKYGYQGKLTTCSLDHPHYWLSAKEFFYYPGEKVEGYHVFYNFCFLPVPAFYTPYYQFQLGPRKIILLMPVVGENNVEGAFIKSEVFYVVDDKNEGSIYFDHLKNKGYGQGFKHRYEINGAPGSFYLYNVNENPVGDIELESEITKNYITKFDQKFYLDDYTELDLEHNYTNMYLIPSGRKDATDFNIALNFNDDWRTYALTNRYDLNYTNDVERIFYSAEHVQFNMRTKLTLDKVINPLSKTRSEAMLLSHTQTLSDNWSFKLEPRYYQVQNASLYPDQRLDVPMTITNKGTEDSFYKEFRIEYLTYIDADGDRVTTDANTEYVNKLPLTTLQLQTLDMDLFNVDTELGVGVFQESKYLTASGRNRKYTATRYTGLLTLYRDFELPLGSTLTLKRNIRQAAYNTGDKHYKISDEPALRTVLWDHVEHDLTYIYSRGDGNSPIYYESPQYDNENRLGESLRFYHKDVFSWKFSGGKNLELNTMDDTLTAMKIKPWGRLAELNFNTGWSYQQVLWRDFVTAFTLRPNEEDSLGINSVFDLNESRYKSASSLLKFHVGKTWWRKNEWNFWQSRWAFSIEHVYDKFSADINLYNLGIYKDLHCWTGQFNYSKAREEWILAFSLKAFPDEPLSLTSNNNGFSIEAFRETLSGQGVSRY